MADLSVAGAAKAVPNVPVTVKPYPAGVKGLETSLDAVCERIRHGRLDPRVRSWAIRTLKDAGNPQGLVDKSQALLDGLRKAAIYVSDPLNAEYIQAAHETLCLDDKGYCFKGGDCFPKGTLLLRQDPCGEERVPIEQVRVGDKIWGLNGWSLVEATVDKGVLLVTQIHLAGRDKPIELTKDHHVYVDYDGVLERVRVRDLLSGQRLATPNSSKMLRGADPRVEELTQDKYEAHCFDIQTSDHYVYLPEHDVTVSNCDDLTVALGSALASVGIPVNVVGQAFNGSETPQHVMLAVYDEKSDQKYRIDPSSDTFPVGQSYPGVTREWWLDPMKNDKAKIDSLHGTDGDIVGVGNAPIVPENDAIYIASTAQLKLATFTLQQSVANLQAALTEVESTRSILRPNMPYDLEPTSPISSLANFPTGGVWTKSMSDLAHDLLHTGEQIANGMQDALNGTRQFYIDVETKDAYIESLPHDSVRYGIIKQGATDAIIGVFSGSTGQLIAGITTLLGAILTPAEVASNTGVQGAPGTTRTTGVGAGPVVIVAGIVGAVLVSLAVAYAISKLCEVAKTKAKEATTQTVLKMVSSGQLTRQQGQDLLDDVSKNRQAELDAERKKDESDPFAKSLAELGKIVLWGVAGGAAIAGIVALAPLVREGAENLKTHRLARRTT